MLTKRIIACLDVKDGKVVKGVQFRGHEVVGEIVDFAKRYREAGIDELVFYDITASAEGRTVSKDWVEQVAKVIDIPFCVAGGIRSVESAREVLNRGADKVSINSPALENPGLISDLAETFGTQCVVVGVDSRRAPASIHGGFEVYRYTGSEAKTQAAGRNMLDWIVEAERRGAGEIVLNCMDRDGTGSGYDIDQLRAARSRLNIPLVASGGARTAADFSAVFKRAGVNAALAAGAFHRGELVVSDLKRQLRSEDIEVRL